MPTVMGQVSVPGNATVAAFVLPPGLCNFTLYQQTTPQSVYIGPSTAVSTTRGMMVPVTPLTQENYSTGPGGTTIYATTGNGTASSFQYIINAQ